MDQDLSALQRQIIAATFNLVRDRDSYGAESWEENVVSVALTQERLREQVETLAQRILNRGITRADEAFQRIAEALPVAVEAMNEAVDSLRALAPGGAIGAEQSALRQLQKAEETYERFVSMERQQQGGGGGGQASAGRAPRIWPTCSSSRPTSCATSTRPCSAASRRAPTRKSTS